MSDDLLSLFKEEASGYLKDLNEGLLKLEMKEGDQKSLLTIMNRHAHSMKGAARAVGYGMVETISHYMEEIFDAALNHGLLIDSTMGDSLYDGLDLIQRRLNDDETEEAIIGEVLAKLEAMVAASHLPLTPRSRQTDSAEIPFIRESSTELPVLKDDITQTAPLPQSPEGVSNELLQIFLVEVSEHLATLNNSLLKVEMSVGQDKANLLKEMNRVAHSLKGASRAVGFDNIESISHYMEEVFQNAINGSIDLTPHVADALYDGLDLIQNVVDGKVLEQDILASVLLLLERIAFGAERSVPLRGNDPVPPAEETPEIEIPTALMTSTIEAVGSSTTLMRAPEESLRVTVSKLDQVMADSSELLVAKLQGESRQRRLQELRREHSKWQREWRSARTAYIRLARRAQETPDGLSAELATLFRFLENNEDYLSRSNRELANLSQLLAQDNMQLGALADQLQENVSGLRMMPFESIVSGFQRMARDVARDVDKRLHLEIRGANLEIDKTVLDALKDPLMHLLRNAIDHGLEVPHERLLLGKNPAGYVLMDLTQRGSEIVIRVSDDGRGLDVDKIRQKAVEKGLLSTQEASSISDDDTRMLVFHSGLSTSAQVTNISGRGIGMDIVRTRVEGLRGRVAIQSIPNQGTTVIINVPVSLTRLRVITLRLGDEFYAIPSVMVERMDTITTSAIFTAEGNEMVTLNERPMPLISLAGILESPSSEARGEQIRVFSIQSPERAIAFEVDQLYNEIELVLKPLGRELINAPFVAGAALTGSGDVMIVLDANDLLRYASGGSLQPRQRPMLRAQQPEARQIRVLVVDDSITTRTLEKNILEAIGFEVHVAIDGMEAWQRIPDIEPDVVVSDVEMPKMNGLELTKLIKATPSLRDLPVILLTSLGKPEQREAGLQAGANAYLIKSQFDQRELLETIKSVL
jgi:two-component system chemotaxis sensor kinase CheA